MSSYNDTVIILCRLPPLLSPAPASSPLPGDPPPIDTASTTQSSGVTPPVDTTLSSAP